MYLNAKNKLQNFTAISGILALFALPLFVEFLEYYPSYLFSTSVILGAGLVLMTMSSLISFRVIVFIIIFAPALSPAFAWLVSEKELFSLAAQYLQRDQAFVSKAVYLYALAAVAYVSMSILFNTKNDTRPARNGVSLKSLDFKVLLLIGLMTLLSAYIIDPGPTILTANYTRVLEGRMESSPLTVLFSTMFGGFWGLLFVYGRHQKKLFWCVTLLAALWLFLHVRRLELFGMALVLLLWGQFILSKKILLTLFLSFVVIQVFIGMVRDVPILDYLKGETHFSSSTKDKAALPGGASNVFLSGLHLVNVKDQQFLSGDENLTMAEWPRTIIPNTLWKGIGLSAVRTEHEIVYDKLELHYVGGMPLLAVYYLNGGVFLVLVFGLLHGYLGCKVDKALNRHLKPNLYRGGTLTIFITVVFIVYQFRYQWYNPHTLFRAVFFSIIFYLLLTALIKLLPKKRPHIKVTWNGASS